MALVIESDSRIKHHVHTNDSPIEVNIGGNPGIISI